MTDRRTSALRTATAAIAALLCAAPLRAAPPVVEAQLNPAASSFESAGGVTAVRFEDYVSNPQPNRADAVTGWVARYPTPFKGLVEPSKANTARSPLPPEVGVVLESPGGTVGFSDTTNLAQNADPRAPVSIRFVDPRDPGLAATVSRVSFLAVGTAVPAGEARVSFLDTAGNEIGRAVLQADPPSRPFACRVDAYARSEGREVSAIHRVVFEHGGGSYLIVGAGPEADHFDVAFGGFEATQTRVTAAPADAPPRRHIDQWASANESVLYPDLSRVEPASALSDRHAKGRWKLIEYETAETAGRAITVGKESEAETVTLKLGRDGWHAVYVGLVTVADLVRNGENRVEVRLSSDPTYARMSNNLNLGDLRRDVVEEVFLRAADLTGEDLEIAFSNAAAAVAYVRLVPLTDEEVAAIQADRRQTETKTLAATFDGHSWIWPYEPRTAQDLANTFTQFRESDFRTWWFQVGGADLVHYPSELGTITGEGDGDGLEVYPRPQADRPYTESILALIENGVHPLQVAVDEAHRQGAEILICTRVGGWKAAPPWEENFRSNFYEAHPEWRCVDIDGTPTMYMSYAVEEVQDHLVEVLRETMATGADGAGVLFHRGMPMVLWEEPFVERFEAEYGVDPRTLPEDDPRVYELRGEIVTQYLGKIRAMLEEEKAKRGGGKRLKLAVTTFSTEADNHRFGLDVERWAKEGLIDQVGIAWFAYHTSGLRTQEQDITYYLRATEGTDVEVFPFLIGWRVDSPEAVLREARSFYEHDIDGIVVWDPQPEKKWREAEGSYWPVLSQLGHIDAVRDGSLNYAPTKVPLKRLGQNHYSRWFPNAGF